MKKNKQEEMLLRVSEAQNLLEQVRADNDELEALRNQLGMIDKRITVLIGYYETKWRKDYDHSDEVTGSYEVLNQDSIFEELARRDELLKRLIKRMEKSRKALHKK